MIRLAVLEKMAFEVAIFGNFPDIPVSIMLEYPVYPLFLFGLPSSALSVESLSVSAELRLALLALDSAPVFTRSGTTGGVWKKESSPSSTLNSGSSMSALDGCLIISLRRPWGPRGRSLPMC